MFTAESFHFYLDIGLSDILGLWIKTELNSAPGVFVANIILYLCSKLV